ncbi:hypothetical protein TrST_g3217 [Triparma strigata]|uniref:Cyanovirin-N domain-containing protein n=1 Tax=Triparma strigata TaxID=1606541 RepID=A0A9W7AB75_9STRA|nr:hypothetical protein TrST_g3217 [Triparma strigata]
MIMKFLPKVTLTLCLLPTVAAFGDVPSRGPTLSCLCDGRFALGDKVKYCHEDHTPFAGYHDENGNLVPNGGPAPNHDEIESCTVIGMRDGELALQCPPVVDTGVDGHYFCPAMDSNGCNPCTDEQASDYNQRYWALPCHEICLA